MKFFLSKAFVLLVVFVLVQIPLHWTGDINKERMANKTTATQSVSKSYAGHQTLAGPVLVFPYTLTCWEDVRNANGEVIRREQKIRNESLSVLPRSLIFDNQMKVEERKVGIFPVPVFRNQVIMQGSFKWQNIANTVQVKPGDSLQWGSPFLAIGISDQHGIKSIDDLKWNDQSLSYAPGSRLALFGAKGIHAATTSHHDSGEADFDIRVALIGTEVLHNLPMAETTSIAIKSDWPHPQFIGAQLPDQRSITDKGFTAAWRSNALATNIQNLWQDCFNGDCKHLQAEAIGVHLIDPTNFYSTIERALKYGFLFLAITFISFILFEVMCNLDIHPVQYTLLGIATGIFFLLLLSLSEHVGFMWAYLIAALACLALLSFYVQALLKHWKRTAVFSVLLSGLYATLFTILQQEDAALLTGSILIFVLLTTTMVLTRNINWYSWQEKISSSNKT